MWTVWFRECSSWRPSPQQQRPERTLHHPGPLDRCRHPAPKLCHVGLLTSLTDGILGRELPGWIFSTSPMLLCCSMPSCFHLLLNCAPSPFTSVCPQGPPGMDMWVCPGYGSRGYSAAVSIFHKCLRVFPFILSEYLRTRYLCSVMG